MTNLKYHGVKTKNGIVGYAKCGSGEPLIMIVGFTGTLFHWNEEFISELAKRFTVYMIDNRKVGISESENTESMSGFAEDVSDFLDALGIIKPIVFGWSMGGVIAQELAKKRKLAALVLMATVPNMQVVNQEFSEFIADAEKYTPKEYKAKLYYYFFSTIPDELMSGKISKSAIKLTDYHYRFNQEARKLQQKVIPTWNGMKETDYQNFKLPTLVLWAKDDLVVPIEAQEFIFDNINLAKLMVYSHGGHFMIHANPRQIAVDVINFYNCKRS